MFWPLVIMFMIGAISFVVVDELLHFRWAGDKVLPPAAAVNLQTTKPFPHTVNTITI